MAVEKTELIATKSEQLVSEIATLAHLINTRTGLCVFLDISGHVDGVDVRISASKKDYSEKLDSMIIYHASEKPVELEALKDKLTNILSDSVGYYGRMKK